MKIYPYTFDSWPRTKGGDPLFTCTEQAIYYAHLACNKVEVIELLKRLRKRAYLDISVQRARPAPNFQRMLDLSVRAQMYRECLEEIKRINENQFDL